MRILSEDTMVVVIDFQVKLMPAIEYCDEIINNSSVLLKGINDLRIPILITEQYTKGLGNTHEDIKNAAQGNSQIIEKVSFSGYENKDIKYAIDSLGRKNIIICGAEAHVCVLQTLIDLRASGYNVILVEDCIGSRKQSDKVGAVRRAMYEGAIVTTYEAILFELVKRADNDEFKKILKLVK